MKKYEIAAPSLEELKRRRPGRKRNAPITLVELYAVKRDELEPKQRVEHARLGVAMNADLLGVTSGEYAKRPRFGVGEFSKERMEKVRRGGCWVSAEQEKTAKGADTGLQRRRLKGAIEVWFERGTISRASWLAAQALQKDYDLMLSMSSAKIAKYVPTVGMSTPDLVGQEMVVEHAMKLEAALRAVDPVYRRVLAWICNSSNEEIPVEGVALLHYPGYSEREAVTRFKGLFEGVCAVLSRHYQHEEKHRWVAASTMNTARELAGLMEMAA